MIPGIDYTSFTVLPHVVNIQKHMEIDNSGKFMQWCREADECDRSDCQYQHPCTASRPCSSNCVHSPHKPPVTVTSSPNKIPTSSKSLHFDNSSSSSNSGFYQQPPQQQYRNQSFQPYQQQQQQQQQQSYSPESYSPTQTSSRSDFLYRHPSSSSEYVPVRHHSPEIPNGHFQNQYSSAMFDTGVLIH